MLRPYLGRIDGKIKWGKRIRLAPYDAPLSQIWKAYGEYEQHAPPAHTISWLLFLYLNSPHYLTLAQRTQNDYQRLRSKLCARTLPDGTPFGKCSLTSITKRTIRAYLDYAPAPIQANRQISLLKAAWSWVEQRHVVPPNPCFGIKPNPEQPRDRYVTHEEYELALSLAPPWLQIAMGLAYWCRARRGEVLALTYDDVVEDGLFIRRSKQSMSEITTGPEVMGLVARSHTLPAGSNRLVRNKIGDPVSEHGFNSAWRRLALRMGDAHFHYHDLKAKGISDMQGEQWAGHKTKKALAVYQRRARRISPQYE